MKFTHPWHDMVAPIWNGLFNWMEKDQKHPVLDYLEVGSFEGASACQMIKLMGEGTVTCIDPWDRNYKDSLGEHATRDYDMEDVQDRFYANVNEARVGTEVRLDVHQDLSKIALPDLHLRVHEYDWIYIDGSHHAADVLLDGLLAWEMLRPGGLLIFDDYIWKPGGKFNPNETPKFAIDTFVTLKFDELRIMPFQSRQVYVQKLNS